MKYTIESNLESKTFYGILRRFAGKILIVFLAMVFSLTSIQAMQTKNGKPRKKKVVKQKKYKKIVKKPDPLGVCLQHFPSCTGSDRKR